jgi:hypothetical protein
MPGMAVGKDSDPRPMMNCWKFSETILQGGAPRDS